MGKTLAEFAESKRRKFDGRITIKDKCLSVEMGQFLEEIFSQYLQSRMGVSIRKNVEAYADIDRVVSKDGVDLYHLEIKVRDRLWDEAVFPERKRNAAVVNEKRGIKTLAICYCLNKADVGYWYDLTKPLYIKMFKRTDRDTESPHGFYKHYEEMKCDGLHEIMLDAIWRWRAKNACPEMDGQSQDQTKEIKEAGESSGQANQQGGRTQTSG